MPFSLWKHREAKKEKKADILPLQSSSSHENFANVPPPPQEQVKSISERSRRGPARHLLERNQDRANKEAQSSASPPARRSSLGGKPPTFAGVDEEPDHYMDRPLPPLPPPSPKKNIVNVDGYDFEICTATTMPQPTRAGYENPPGRPRLVNIPPRKTRSSTRAHKRADSAQEETTADSNTIGTDTRDFASDQPDSPALPAPLIINKSATSHESSPHQQQQEENMAPSPSTITMRKKRPSIDEDRDGDVSPHTDIDNAAAAAFAPPTSRLSQEIGLARTTPDYPPGLPIRQAPPRGRNQRHSSASRYSTVAVRPPMFDPTKIPAHQFISDLPSNSRPTAQWGWTKRWTCCKCGGQTIVEQIICACLECAHDRCPELCSLEKTDKLETSAYVLGKMSNAANAGRVD